MLAYVVMPSHFHWVMTPCHEYEKTVPKGKSTRELIMQSIRRFSARECNEVLGETGNFWQPETYDHCAEDSGELERIIDYVELNPVKAKYVKSREEWKFSSAFDRQRYKIPFGQPLVRPE